MRFNASSYLCARESENLYQFGPPAEQSNSGVDIGMEQKAVAHALV